MARQFIASLLVRRRSEGSGYYATRPRGKGRFGGAGVANGRIPLAVAL